MNNAITLAAIMNALTQSKLIKSTKFKMALSLENMKNIFRLLMKDQDMIRDVQLTPTVLKLNFFGARRFKYRRMVY